MELPVYYLELNEGDGLTQVSLVQSPAIEENFHAFADQFVKPKDGEGEQEFISRCIPVLIGEGKDQEQAAAICYGYWEDRVKMQAFSIQDEEKRIITGPAMIAEKSIYRRGPDGSEFYVKFSAATIEKAVRMWATQGKYNAVNAEHSSPVGGLFLMESFITDPTRGINPPEAWKDAPAGSWFLSYYVQDDALWAKVKSGEFKGFSVEGYFTDKPADEAEQTLTSMRDLLKNFRNSETNPLSEMQAKDKIQQIRALLGFSEEAQAAPTEQPLTFGEGTLADGTVIRWQGETLESGALLEVQTPEGEFVPAPDGTHETADGQLVTTEGGIVTEIMLKENGKAPAAMKNDGSKDDVVAAFARLEKFQVDENLKIVLKALMEYCFGWELREAEQKQIREAAINSYKQGFSAIEKKLENLIKAQTQTIEVIEQFSAIPASEPARKPHGFGRTMQSTEDRLAKVAENLRNIKNNK